MILNLLICLVDENINDPPHPTQTWELQISTDNFRVPLNVQFTNSVGHIYDIIYMYSQKDK